VKQYQELLKTILKDGEVREDRTGVGTKSIFGGQLTFDLRESFPLVSIKKTLWKSAFIEMLWFLRGEPNIKFLKEHNVPIWDSWADENGSLGPVYGVQWRKWKSFSFDETDIPVIGQRINGDLIYNDARVIVHEIDQIKQLIHKLKINPKDRRLIVTAWNPSYIDVMGLPPCHRDFQCYVSNDGYLDLMWAQRSVDTLLGLPFNCAQYGLLLNLLARTANLKPRFLKVNYGDAHIYTNHLDAAEHIVTLEPKPNQTKFIINTDNIDIDHYKIEDFGIEGYEFHPFIKLPVAV
jgi:thymidylate synthase